MPEPLTTSREVQIEAQTADNLCVQLFPCQQRIVCIWEEFEDPPGAAVFRHEHIFNGSEFVALADGHDFDVAKTNYENIRDVMYAALKAAGKL